MTLLLALACAQSEPSGASTGVNAREDGWTILVWMDGDNNLETYVPGDLNELERAATDGVSILVQADRIDGYSRADGNWTGTRRYEIVADDTDEIISPIVEDLGEADMGSPDALSEFLLWGDALRPADKVALVLWNHGGGFWIASDDTSGSKISLDEELEAGLLPLVESRGKKIDVVAFDACNMGEWETAVALRDTAEVLVASQAWVNGGGYAYDLAFPAAGADSDAFTLGDQLAYSAAIDNDELTHSAVSVAAVADLTDAIDLMAGAFLDAPAGMDAWFAARDASHGLDRQWDEWWLDLGDFADQVALGADPVLSASGSAVRSALDAAVIVNYTRDTLPFASGLTVFADTSGAAYVDHYGAGPWGETRWDEVVIAAYDLEQAASE